MKNISYNKAIEELESILYKIEQSDLDVDELADKVKRATELINLCKKKLRGTEIEIEKVLNDIDTPD